MLLETFKRRHYKPFKKLIKPTNILFLTDNNDNNNNNNNNDNNNINK